MANAPAGGKRPGNDERLTAFQNKLRALKDSSALREVMERDLLLEFLTLNHSAISEYPMLEAQQETVVELLCGRAGHPGYEYIHKRIAHFIVLLAHYEKAVNTGDTKRIEELKSSLLNTESILIKCAQGIVYAMAIITDNFEEIVLRYFGQPAMQEYSTLIEKHKLDQSFWAAFVDQFIARKVVEAHKEILEGEKFNISKERTFLVIRFLFDDILAKLNPSNQKIDKTRIQKSFIDSRETPEGQKRVKIVQGMLVKRLSALSQFKKFTARELLQASRITCIDAVGEEFEKLYEQRVADAKAVKENPEGAAKDPETVKDEQAQFKFLLEQVIGVGVGASIAIGRISDYFYKALEDFVPEHIQGILPLKTDFSIPVLEKILFFLLENNLVHLLKERGRDEGGKIQVRSGRARRVTASEVDGLAGMTKIRKKQLFGNDVTRDDTLLFKPKTAKQMEQAMSMLSLEPELQKALTGLWKKAVFRVDIMVLINLELVARTTTNLTVRLGEILEKYGVAIPSAPEEEMVDKALE